MEPPGIPVSVSALQVREALLPGATGTEVAPPRIPMSVSALQVSTSSWGHGYMEVAPPRFPEPVLALQVGGIREAPPRVPSPVSALQVSGTVWVLPVISLLSTTHCIAGAGLPNRMMGEVAWDLKGRRSWAS